jgi:hypothetical protein
MTFFGLDLNMSASAIIALFYFLFIIFVAIASYIMLWHWRKYGFGERGVALANIVYLVGLVILFCGTVYEFSFLK